LDGDAASLSNRIIRYRFVANRFPIAAGLFLGGIPQVFAFEEMQRCYVSANYMAVVLCAQVFAEHSLAVTYAMTGEDKAVRAGFAKLIDLAVADGDLDVEIANRLHRLRKMRNPYTHPAVGSNGYEERLVIGKHPIHLLQEDAEFALDTIAQLVRKK
jgi:hypothetical protein